VYCVSNIQNRFCKCSASEQLTTDKSPIEILLLRLMMHAKIAVNNCAIMILQQLMVVQ